MPPGQVRGFTGVLTPGQVAQCTCSRTPTGSSLGVGQHPTPARGLAPRAGRLPGQAEWCACLWTSSSRGLGAGWCQGWGQALSLLAVAQILPLALVCGVCPLGLGACSELVMMSQSNLHISLWLYRVDILALYYMILLSPIKMKRAQNNNYEMLSY